MPAVGQTYSRPAQGSLINSLINQFISELKKEDFDLWYVDNDLRTTKNDFSGSFSSPIYWYDDHCFYYCKKWCGTIDWGSMRLNPIF